MMIEIPAHVKVHDLNRALKGLGLRLSPKPGPNGAYTITENKPTPAKCACGELAVAVLDGQTMCGRCYMRKVNGAKQ